MSTSAIDNRRFHGLTTATEPNHDPKIDEDKGRAF